MSALPAPRPAGGPLAPVALRWLYQGLSATWRVRYQNRALFDETLAEGPAVFAFWHGDQLLVIGPHAHRGLVGMVSRSRDGELLARVLDKLGYQVARGSSSRGGARAARESLRHLQRGASPALAVDGPRGPRHSVQPGAVTLSALSRRPILYVVAHARPALRLGSWDRMAVPAPFAAVTIRYGRMEAPHRKGIAAAQEALGERMRAASAELGAGDVVS